MRLTQYPRNADGSPMNVEARFVQDRYGSFPTRLLQAPLGPDNAPLPIQALLFTDEYGNFIPPILRDELETGFASISAFGQVDTPTNAAATVLLSFAEGAGSSRVVDQGMAVGTFPAANPGVELLGNFAITYARATATTGNGTAVQNKRGRGFDQKCVGRAFLARPHQILDNPGTGTANQHRMYGDSIAEYYIGPRYGAKVSGVYGVQSFTNYGLSGTDIDQFINGTGAYADPANSAKTLTALKTAIATGAITHLTFVFAINTPDYGGSPTSYAASVANLMAQIRGVALNSDPTKFADSTVVGITLVLGFASRDGAMTGSSYPLNVWRRDENYVFNIRAPTQAHIDTYEFCIYDPTVSMPETEHDAAGKTNSYIAIDIVGVHPLYGNAAFHTQEIFDINIPSTIRQQPVPMFPTGSNKIADAADAPTTYLVGPTTMRATTGFLVQGYVDITYGADGYPRQKNYGIAGETYWYERGSSGGSPTSATWDEWVFCGYRDCPSKATTGADATKLVPAATFSNPVSDEQLTVGLNGAKRGIVRGFITGPGTTLAANVVLAVAPVIYRPATPTAPRCIPAAVFQSPATWEYNHSVTFDGATGELRLNEATAINADRVYIEGTYAARSGV